jgi:flagellar basal body rod protein FlgG
MDSQLYTAASGLLAEERRLELLSNNLANVSTPGFRAQRAFAAVFQRFGAEAPQRVRAANAGVAIAGSYEAAGPGPVGETGRLLDVALPPGRFLAVQTPEGKRYTRAGNLQSDASGALVDAAGRRLFGADGKPIEGLATDPRIAADGRVFDGANEVGRLLVVSDPGHVLRPEGGNLLTPAGADSKLEQESSPSLRPGWLEGSAVDALGEMVQLIESQRAFESYQKIVSLTANEVDRHAVNDIAG